MSSYKEVGFENEGFYGWGLEDGERYLRWKRFGYTVKRISGPLFHLSHPRGLSCEELQSPEHNFMRMKEVLSTYFINTGKKHLNMKIKLLQKMSDYLIATNQEMEIGLLDGSMGLCLFMYH